MKPIVRSLSLLVAYLCLPFLVGAQDECYEVSLQNVALEPTPYVSLGIVQLSFEICNESDIDLPVQETPTFEAEFEVTIDATSGNMLELTHIDSVEGTAAEWFDWQTGFADTTIYIGTQNQAIPAMTCGTIIMFYQITENTFDGSGPLGTGQNCVNINLQPSTLISASDCHDETDDAASICTHVDEGTILPLQLQSFVGAMIDGETHLEWRTGFEENVSHFEVQRSADGVNFDAFRDVEAVGGILAGAIYNEVDPLPFVGSTYYRLKMFDLDGSYTFSHLVEVRAQIELAGETKLFPNPASSRISIISAFADQARQVLIYDVQGRVIMRDKLAADQVLSSHNVETLQPGLYLVSIVSQRKNEVLRLQISR